MDTSANPGYFVCTHCNENVSETTLRRYSALQSRRLTSKRLGTSSSSDSDSEEVSNHLHFPGNSLKILVVINICC